MTAQAALRETVVLNTIRNLVDDFDPSLQVRLLALIAAVTKEEYDILMATSRAVDHRYKKSSAEALAALVWSLARRTWFKEARKIVPQMAGMNLFWRAQAFIGIVRFSGNADDESAARFAVGSIQGIQRACATHDLQRALRRHIHIGKQSPFGEEINALYLLLCRLRSLKSGDQKSSVDLNYSVERMLGQIFSKIMD